ncbi:hypothetical protein LTR94_026028, partial [Friedmanniomyces endolithicus]
SNRRPETCPTPGAHSTPGSHLSGNQHIQTIDTGEVGEPAFGTAARKDRDQIDRLSDERAGLWNPESWDAATSISFGKIYADSLQRPEIEEDFNRMTDENNLKL